MFCDSKDESDGMFGTESGDATNGDFFFGKGEVGHDFFAVLDSLLGNGSFEFSHELAMENGLIDAFRRPFDVVLVFGHFVHANVRGVDGDFGSAPVGQSHETGQSKTAISQGLQRVTTVYLRIKKNAREKPAGRAPTLVPFLSSFSVPGVCSFSHDCHWTPDIVPLL
jgi:hypothetical protein